jgi:hypothetical protein
MFKWTVTFSIDVIQLVKERSGVVDSYCHKNVEISIYEEIGCISAFICNMGYKTSLCEVCLVSSVF